MEGRYGTDDLSKVLLGACLVCLVLNIFIGFSLLYILALVLLVWCYYRMFSRNIAKRSAENDKYHELLDSFTGLFRRGGRSSNASSSRDYHIYKCPSCGQKIRVPRGKGKILITCPKCHNEFQKRS